MDVSDISDSRLVVCDVGNTRLGIGVFAAGTLVHTARESVHEPQRWEATLTQIRQRFAGEKNLAIAGSSVNPAAAQELDRIAHLLTGEKVQWVGKDLALPIKVLTDPPSATGIDRIVNVAAAYQQVGRACVVVSAGTAITIDCCNSSGEFLGGAIAPGAAMMFAALHEKTAQLPLIELKKPAEVFGRTTTEAIRHGIYDGIRGLVRQLVDNYTAALGERPALIATGGDAPLLFADWEPCHAVSPNLSLYGIALSFTKHHAKRGDS